ncbi:MAG: hypothetical protein PHT54_02910 [Candidatus Nanoarchaeia archaeon]|nr:hypothetical protein [Candidatus Nanoarchaeia archaeon]
MKQIIIIITILTVLSLPVLAVDALGVYSSECTNKGDINIVFYIAENNYKVESSSMELEINKIKYEEPWSNQKYLRKGTDSTKESNTAIYAEGTFNEDKVYSGSLKYIQEYLKDDSKGENATITLAFTVSCPGLRFSCNNLGVSIESCKNTPDGFEAIIDMKGMEQSVGYEINPETMMDYHFTAESSYKQIEGNSKEGGLPEKYAIEKISDNKYKFTTNIGSNTIKEMNIRYKSTELPIPCHEPSYENITFYSHKECSTAQTTEPEKETQESTEEEIESKPDEQEEKGSSMLGIVIVIILIIIAGFVYFKQKQFKHKL